MAAGFLIDLTFTPGPNAIGGFLEYRAVTPRPNGPAAQVLYPWKTALNVGNVIGYFQFTTNPMVLTNVSGNNPDFQPNTAYEFRIKQICPDGTEPYSDIDGTYWIPECIRFTTSIEVVPVQQGAYGIGITWVFTPGSSVETYTVNLYDFQNNMIGTTTINSSQLDQINSTPYTYIFTSANTTTNLLPGIGYSAQIIPGIQTVSEPAASNIQTVGNCARGPIKAPFCDSYDIETGDQWGIEWFDCTANLHNCYSNQPYTNNLIRICSLGPPRTYYCDGASFVDGYAEDGGGNVTNGGRVTLVNQGGCLGGYSDFSTGLTYPNGAPVTCIPNPTCGAANLIIAGRCVAPTDFDGTTFRNGDPIPYVDNQAEWSAMTSPAYCWINNQVGGPYGKVYNWYALTDPRNIAPVGYHVPTRAEWLAWMQDIIDSGKTPNDLRAVGPDYWNNNSGATDFYGFGARGSGSRYINGAFLNVKENKWYWMDNSADPTGPWGYVLSTGALPPGYYSESITILPGVNPLYKREGFSIRLFCD